MTRAERLNRYEKLSDLPLLVLSLCVIPLLAVEAFAGVEHAAEQTLNLTYAVIWGVFVADYLMRFALADEKGAYVRQEWLALLINVVTAPIPLSWLAWFRLLRSARALRLFRIFRLGGAVTRSTEHVVKFPENSNTQLGMALSVFLAVTLVSAVLVLGLEEGSAGSAINTMGDALWWAIGTITTVGSGDIAPKSPWGRVIAGSLMIIAVGFIGVVASNLAARLFGRLEPSLGDLAQSPEEQAIDDLRSQIEALTKQLQALPGGPDSP